MSPAADRPGVQCRPEPAGPPIAVVETFRDTILDTRAASPMAGSIDRASERDAPTTRRMTADDVRRHALALPDTVEADHHGRPSFRVGGRIFATIWDETTVNVMLDEPGIRTAVAAHPGWCSERYWGKRLAAVAVDLPHAVESALAELLADAWEGKSGRPVGSVRP